LKNEDAKIKKQQLNADEQVVGVLTTQELPDDDISTQATRVAPEELQPK
jgi:hypothetical protein